MFMSVVSVGEERYLWKIREGVCGTLCETWLQAKMCVFPNPISDLTEVLREEWYKTYPMQVHGAEEYKTLRYVRPKESKYFWISDTERLHVAMRSAGKLLQTVPKLILQLLLTGWVIDLRVKDTEKAV